MRVTEEQKAQVLNLAADFPRLWRDPKTPDRDRKRMARLLIADVTLRKDQDIRVQVRFKGGATHELRLPLPKSAWELRLTNPEIIAEIDRLVPDHAESEIAGLLNARGWRSGCGKPFTLRLVNQLRRKYGIKGRRERLREQGWLTVHEVAQVIGCYWGRINYWRVAGLIEGVRVNDKDDRLYKPPSDCIIAEIRQRQRKSLRKNPPQTTNQSEHLCGVV